MAEPLVKWAVEVTRLEDLPRIVRRAAKIAMTPPTGPVFISLPGDILNDEAGIDLGASTRIDTRVRPSDDSLGALADRLLRAENPVLLCGNEIVKSDALAETAELAALIGAAAYQQTVPFGSHFLSEHPCFMGALSRDQKQVRATLAPYDLMVVVGADVLRMSVFDEVDPLPDGLPIIQIGLDDWEMGKNYPAEMAVAGDVRETLRALIPALQERGGESLSNAAPARVDALAARNWTAKRSWAGRGHQSPGHPYAHPSRLADVADCRDPARGRDRRRGRDLVDSTAERLAALSGAARPPWARQRWHRLGDCRCGRRATGASRPCRLCRDRRREFDVLDPGIVDRSEPEAATDLCDQQQWRLSGSSSSVSGHSMGASISSVWTFRTRLWISQGWRLLWG